MNSFHEGLVTSLKSCFNITNTATGMKTKLNELLEHNILAGNIKMGQNWGNTLHKSSLQNIGCCYKL